METNSSAETAHHEDSKDLISALPNDVAYIIMRSLPLVNAARMSILSSTWRTRWLSLPQFAFDRKFYMLFKDHYFAELNPLDLRAYKWSTAISNILLLHKGPIVEFSLCIPNFESFIGPDISPLISYVSRMGVKILAILNNNQYSPFKWPPTLFSQLKNLSLRGCVVGHIPHYRGLRNLLILELIKVTFTEKRYKEFIHWCPLLETLSFSRCSIKGEFIIDWLELKNLSLDRMTMKYISFKNASSLVSFSLYSLEGNKIPGAVDMIKYLASSCKLERLSLQYYACMIFYNEGVSKILPVTFEHLKSLKLEDIRVDEEEGEFLCILGLIRSCPNMEELKIFFRDGSQIYNLKEKTKKAKISIEFDTELDHSDIPECAFNQLHTIYLDNITCVKEELKLTSYLLDHSPSLKQLFFRTFDELEAPLKSWLYRRKMH